MRLDFTALKTVNEPGGSDVLDRQIEYIRRAFLLIETLAGKANGFAILGADGLLTAAQLGNLVTSATLHVTGTAATNTAVTVTLPAVAGKYHAITSIQLTRTATGPLAGSGTLITTTTNLPGNPAWTNGNTMSAGLTVVDLNYQPANPLRSLVAGTATTITMPAAGANVINRINVSYLTVSS